MVTLFAVSLLMPQKFRPPAVPLVTHDPYFSVWSFNDKLTDDWTKHWTGKNQAMCGMIRVDGKTYRWMSRGLDGLPAAEQESVQVLPSRTVYTFRAGGVRLRVTFEGNQDIRSAEACSRSDTSIELMIASADGNAHEVQAYMDACAELAVDNDSQQVEWSRFRFGTKEGLAMWHSAGVPLNRSGDDHRIDWGRLWLFGQGGSSFTGDSDRSRQGFTTKGRLPDYDDTDSPKPVRQGYPVLAWTSESLKVSEKETRLNLGLAYDDVSAIEYFHRPLRAAWRSENGDYLHDLTAMAVLDSARSSWDSELVAEWSKYGSGFADLATLSYRQCLAAHKIVRDLDGSLLMFSKENFSNGCIGTVDVMYPACPIFLAYNPSLLKANLKPILDYAAMPRWKWKFAPHDLGQYPKANGQVYGGGELTEDDQMPVEESGNMLIMCAAYLDKTGDEDFIKAHWKQLTEWADYLKLYGVDPGNQLCTDDFAGHLAHNANLSVKAIVAMACYGRMAGHIGDRRAMKEWNDTAKGFVKDWMKMADDGDHYRLAFDKPGTWSQKYNLVWDKVMNLGLFPKEVYDKEVAWYLKHRNKYGLPLDNRADYTKLDWTVWTACLASDKGDFDAIMAPVYLWMNETPDRLPLTDWFDTKTGKCVGFRARSVVGGVFMPLLLPKP